MKHREHKDDFAAIAMKQAMRKSLAYRPAPDIVILCFHEQGLARHALDRHLHRRLEAARQARGDRR